MTLYQGRCEQFFFVSMLTFLVCLYINFNLAFDLLMIFSAIPSPVRDLSSSTPRYLTGVWHVSVLPAHCTCMELFSWSFLFEPKSIDSAILWLIQALRKVCSEFPQYLCPILWGPSRLRTKVVCIRLLTGHNLHILETVTGRESTLVARHR